jgi:hypothetical protein
MPVANPEFEFVMELDVKVASPIEVSATRRVIPILGGTVKGPRVQGTVLAAGADFQIVREDGTLELTAQYVIETSDGTRIYVENRGLRTGPAELLEKMRKGEAVDPAAIYFRGVPRFETGSAAYQWLTSSIFVCLAERHPASVHLMFYRLL